MFKRLEILKKHNYKIKHVIDCGAYIGEWSRSFLNIYPYCSIKAFEPNPICEPDLKEKKIDYKICLLGNSNDIVPYYMTKSACKTGNSMFLENTIHFQESNYTTFYMRMEKLDDLCEFADFIKLDTQGSELLILEGASRLLEGCLFVLMETSIIEYNKNAPRIEEVISYMKQKNFRIYDIVDMNYNDQLLIQVDILFINAKIENKVI